MEARGGGPETVLIYSAREVRLLSCFLDSSIDDGAGFREGIALIGEAFNTQLDSERYVERNHPSRGHCLWMPPTSHCFGERKLLVVFGFLLGLPSTVSTLAILIFWDSDEFLIPIDPISCEVSDFTSSKPQPTCQ